MLSWRYVAAIAVLVCVATVYVVSTKEEDERTIRSMVDRSVGQANQGDISALDDFCDENADYVGVDGTLIKGRAQMHAFFRKMAESSKRQQVEYVEQIRFITPQIATVDGADSLIKADSWSFLAQDGPLHAAATSSNGDAGESAEQSSASAFAALLRQDKRSST